MGIDGIYRIIKTPYGECGTKGYWKDDQTFVLLFQFLDSGDLQTAVFTFADNQLNLQFKTAYMGAIANVAGKISE